MAFFTPESATAISAASGEKRLKVLPFAGDEAALAGLDVGERPEPVELQLEQPVAMVERLSTALKGERGEARKEPDHAGSIRAATRAGSRRTG